VRQLSGEGEIYEIVTNNAQNLVHNRNRSLKLGLMFTNIIIKIYTCAKNITRGKKWAIGLRIPNIHKK
jgi:hypothetical protein